ncbi:MAG: TSUP family transporter, partial [Clostridia bacterium]
MYILTLYTGLARKKRSGYMKRLKKHTMWISAVGGLIAGFLNGLFGSGGGTVIVPFLEEF